MNDGQGPRIRRRLDAPIPQFPELDHCVGRVVEITVLGDADAAGAESADPVAPFCQATIGEEAEEVLPAAAGDVPAFPAVPLTNDGAVRPPLTLHLEVAPADSGLGDAANHPRSIAPPDAPASPAEEKLDQQIEEFLTEWQRLRRGR